MKLKPIEEQVVVVMGASSGIGRATALKLAAQGAKVVVAARSQSGIESLVHEIREQGGEATPVVADVSDFAQVQHVANTAVEKYGRLDTWVHCSGVLIVAPFDQITPEEFHRVIEVNLLGQAYGAMAALPHLKREGQGALIHVSSIESRRGLPLHAPYSASKHGIKGMLEAMRVEFAHDHVPIAVTNIMPASINTPLFSNARTKIGVKPQGMPPYYEPEVVADAILYAATHPSRDIIIGGTGAMLVGSEKVAPKVLDLLSQAIGYRVQKTDEYKSVDGPDNLFAPLPEHDTVRGKFSGQSFSSSLYTWLQKHPGIRLSTYGALGALALGAFTFNTKKWSLLRGGLKLAGKASLWTVKRKMF